MFFARVQDWTGPADGLNGVVVDVWFAESREELVSRVGEDYASEFVEADDVIARLAGEAKEGESPRDIRGWRYEDGVLIDPEA